MKKLAGLILWTVGYLFGQVWLYEEQTAIDSMPYEESKEHMDLEILDSSSVPWHEDIEEVKSDQGLQQVSDSLVLSEEKAKTDSTQQVSDSTALALDSMDQQNLADDQGNGKGSLQMVIFSEQDAKSLAQVDVVAKNDSLVYHGVSDQNGIVIIRNMQPGIYRVALTRKGYLTKELKSFPIRRNQKNSEQISLARRVAKGTLIQVKKPKENASEAMRSKRQNAGVVMEGVSAEQIAKSTDSDAGAIAKRVTGTSVVGGKYVFVRGLGERYTNMTLNGLPVPTPEKDKRVVPQDLFPASALESFAIYKTFSPDLPADFGGGSVALETKGFPDQNFTKIGFGIGATEYWGDGEFFDVGKSRLHSYRGNGLSTWFGLEDGSSSVPNGVPRVINSITYPDPNERANYASKWNNRWSVDSVGMFVDQKYSFSMGRVYQAPYQGKAGFLFNMAFQNDFDEGETQKIKVANRAVTDSVTIIRHGEERRVVQIVRDTVDGVPQMLRYLGEGLEQNISSGSYNTKLSGLLNMGYENRNHILWFKSLLANLSEESTLGVVSLARPDVSAGQENPIEERFYSEFSRRTVLIGQLGGGHYIGKSVLDSMSWALGLAKSEGITPDSRAYFYSRYDETAMQYDIKAPFGTRQFQEFQETGFSGRFDLNLVIPPEWSSQDLFREDDKWLRRVTLPTLDVGALFSYKTRDFDLIKYSWSGLPRVEVEGDDYGLVDRVHHPDSVAAYVRENGIGFASSLGDYDTYNADEFSWSTYFSAKENFQLWGIPTTLNAGMRHEIFLLDFLAPYTSERSVLNPELRMDSAKVIHELTYHWYPSMGLHFEFIPRTKTRFLWSKTIVRPEIRERAPTFFYDPQEEIEVIGNPDLKDTKISNYDFRFDWFLPYQQMMSFSLFYKDFKDPIEYYINGNLSPNRKLFQNAKGAYVEGLEMEVDLAPGRVFDSWKKNRWLKGIGFYANAAWIRSRVSLDTTADGADLLTSKSRPLIGQSPWLYNVKLTHDLEWGQMNVMNGLLYNIAGPRIKYLGVDKIPDVIEDPFGSLDYILKWTRGHQTISLKIKNILNSEKSYSMKEFNHRIHYVTISDEERDRLYSNVPLQKTMYIMRTKPGISFSLSYDWKF